MSSLPRVTHILEEAALGPDFGAATPADLEAGRRRGARVHAAIEADHYGYPVDIPPAIAPYLDAYRKFVAESGHEPIASEVEVIHPAWQYVGHVDRVGWLLGRRAILDWKSGGPPDLKAAGDQLSGYKLAWNAMHPGEPVEALGVLHLREDGTYRFHEIAGAEHEQVFLAAVVVYRTRKERGR